MPAQGMPPPRWAWWYNNLAALEEVGVIISWPVQSVIPCLYALFESVMEGFVTGIASV